MKSITHFSAFVKTLPFIVIAAHGTAISDAFSSYSRGKRANNQDQPGDDVAGSEAQRKQLG